MQSSADPLQRELSRILASDTSKDLVSQIKQLSSYQSKIQEDLMQKTAQIAKLQIFLRKQIENVQGIVEQNEKLKRSVEMLSKELVLKKEESERLERLLQEASQNNEQYLNNINELEQKKFDLQVELRAEKGCKIQVVCVEVQTENNGYSYGSQLVASRSINTSPLSIRGQSSLLQKVEQLQSLVTELKLEKGELLIKLKEMQLHQTKSIASDQSQSQLSIKATMKSTTQIVSEVCQQQLQEIKFRGEIFNGLKEGKGICYYEEDVQYEGNFKQGKRHGLGTLYAYGQSIYRGFWVQGLIQGKGVLRMLEGQIEAFEGQFFEGKLQGYGCMKLKSGKRVLGFWQGGKMQGRCIELLQGSKRYISPELIECY